jgi:hypothetical protein
MSTGYTHANYLHLGVAAPNPRASASVSARPAPLLSRCTVHAQGLKNWGGGFI